MIGWRPAAEFEDEQLDFKEQVRSPKETLGLLSDAAVCFANTRGGGTIVLGVRDKAVDRRQALVGVDAELTPDLVRKGIHARTEPPLVVRVEEHFEDETRLLVIDVPEGLDFYATTKGISTRRVGRDCVPFSPVEQRQERQARGDADWSSEATGLGLEALDELEFSRLRKWLLRLTGDRAELADLDDQRLLAALNLFSADGSLSRAAILLLGHETAIREGVPGHDFTYQYRATPGSEAQKAERSARPIIAGIEDLLRLVVARATEHAIQIAGGQQIVLTDYPERAIREALVNAFAHRSYEELRSLDIEHTEEQLTVESPGGFIGGVTPENVLTHPSVTRNALLASALTSIGLAEKTGQGVDRMYREMLSVGKRPPEIAADPFRVRVVLIGGIGNDAFVRFLNELPEQWRRDVDVLLALSVLRTRQVVNAELLAGVIQRTAPEAQRVLERLAADDGILEPTRRTMRNRLPDYRLRSAPLAALGRALSYRRRTLDDTDQKVVEQVREAGFVTNQTLQRLFDVNMTTARNMLADLVRREILTITSDHKRGPRVEYGPGPRFPRKRASRSRRR